jgi:hypothetical protein
MIENVGDLELTDEYWDCECERNFIHPCIDEFCMVCEAKRVNQPDSRVAEVLSHGFIINQEINLKILK